jgi:hypothetical protein
MGDIFHKADHVLICLGEYDDDGEYAVETILNELRAYRRQCPKRSKTEKPHPLAITALGVSIYVDIARIAHSLAALSSRPYFSRV